MATTGRKTVAPGQTIASDWGQAAWDQSVQCFASIADRDNQYGAGAVHSGSMAWLDDVKQLTVYAAGIGWRVVGADITVSGSQLTGIGYDPTKHRPHTFWWHTSVTTNAFGQINVPVNLAGFAGYMALHGAANNRAWFTTIDFSNPPSLSAALIVMRDTTGATAANQSVDISVNVSGWK
jgi:hypothetical protein